MLPMSNKMGTTRTILAVTILLLGWLCVLSGASTRVGGIRDIPDVEHNKEIQDLGRFAVDEYNKQQNVSLSFCKVVKAEERVVAGVRYYLTIEAKDGGKTGVYAAEIWVKAWENFKQLLDFKPVQTPH